MLIRTESEPTAEPVITANWLAAPTLSEADITGTFWTFGSRGERPRTNFLVLAPGGLIGNHHGPDEDQWQILGGRLVFVSTRGAENIVFDAAEIEGAMVVALSGRNLMNGSDETLELRRTRHPPHPLHPSSSDADRTVTFLQALKQPRRRNLVVLRAGKTSLHHSWTRDIASSERNWDLCVSYYDPDLPHSLGELEYLTHQPTPHGTPAVYDLFFAGSPLWHYDLVWLPDDDLATGWGDINRLFHLARAYGLDLAQPSLAQRPDCFFSHPVTLQQPDNILRYTNFVEALCPVFSRRALRVCIGSFRDSRSGYGLDYLWPRFLGGPSARLAIIDAISVIHTRPAGQNYDVKEAFEELHATLHAYQCVVHQSGCIVYPSQAGAVRA
jgi:hypothetical protein